MQDETFLSRSSVADLNDDAGRPNTHSHFKNWSQTFHSTSVGFGKLKRLNPLRSSYWALYRQLDDVQSRCILALGFTCAVAAGVPLPLIAVIFRGVVDTFPPEVGPLRTAIYEIIGVAVAYFVVTWTWAVCWGITGGRISRRLQESLVTRIVGSDMSFFDVDAPDLTSILTADTQTVQRGTSEKVGLFIQSVSYFIATFITGFILSAPLTGVLFAAVVPTLIILISTGSYLVSRYSKRANELVDRAAAVAEGAIGAVTVVQAFGAHDVLCSEHARILRLAATQAFKKSTVGALMLALVYFVCYAINSLAFYYGSHIGGSSGTIFAVVFLILDASFVFNQVGPFIQNIAMAAGAGSKLLNLINMEKTAIDVYSEAGHRVDATSFRSSIVLEGVSFAYPARPHAQILNSVDLEFQAGTSNAIVGLSGSGKSTVASLLLRLYDPTSGHIKLGHEDFKGLHVSTLRSQISLVDQDPVLFSGTILDNIRHGICNPEDLDDAEIFDRCTRAAAEANADFIESLSQGIHTQVSSTIGLSGGQRQRICLARALVRKPSLLVLDEPTSALDATSERKVLEALGRVSGSGCTVIVIAHRLATIKHSSKIIAMGEGRVLEQGTHDELMALGGTYESLVKAQQMEPVDQTPLLASQTGSESTISSGGTDEVDEKLELGEAAVGSRAPSNRDSTVKRQESSPPDGAPARASGCCGLFRFNPLPTSWTLIERCLSMSRPERVLLVTAVIAAIVSGTIIVGEAIIFGNLISALNTQTDRAALLSRVEFLSLMFFVISLVAFMTYGVSGVCFGLTSETFLVRVRDRTLRTILQQDQIWFQDPEHSSSKLMAAMSADTNSLSGLSGVIIGTAFSVSSNIVSGLVVSLVVAWKIAIVLIATTPAIVAAGFLRVKMLTVFDTRHTSDFKAAAAMASEACTNIRTVAAFGREREVFEKYRVAIHQPYQRSFKYNVFGNLALAFSYSVIYFVYSLAYYWGAEQVRNGTYSQKDFFIVLPAFLLTAQQSGQFFSMAPEVIAARSAALKIFTTLDAKPSISSDADKGPPSTFLERRKISDKGADSTISKSAATESAPHRTEKEHSGSAIQFEAITLAYPTRPEQAVLSGLDFAVRSGEFVGIVGPSGAGKSSIISLIERFYDPTGGRIIIDGQDIRSMPVEAHRSRISLVSQEPVLFAGSISFNISLGAVPGHTVTQEEIEEVCKRCGVHKFVTSLAEGYLTECGQRGSKLSGGQKQRIAVARALIRDPQILLLDEATSALDSHSEKEVQSAVGAASSGRTTIVVAHRLSSIQSADRILVFDGGRLIEQGTHSELVSRGGVYNDMARAQALG